MGFPHPTPTFTIPILFLTIDICEFQNYIDTDPTERNSCNTLIFTVFQGEEPKSFTSDFPTWNVSMIYCVFAGFGMYVCVFYDTIAL